MKNCYISPFSPLPKKEEEGSLAERFLASLAHPKAMQEYTLLDILHRAKGSQFACEHGFATIKNVEEFRKRVPLSSAADYLPYFERLAKGEKNLLFSGETVQFLQTSGTSGENKWIPLNDSAISVARLVSLLRSYFRRQAVIEAGLAPKGQETGKERVFLFSSPSQIASSACGVPVAYASGMTNKLSSLAAKQMRLCPPSVFEIEDTNLREKLLLVYALSCPDVVAAIGNNPRRLLALLQKAEQDVIIDAVREGRLLGYESFTEGLPKNPSRASFLRSLKEEACFSPRHYWPQLNMACLWLSGPMSPAIDVLKELLPRNTLFFDAGYGASELKINIPLVPDTPFAPPALFAGFFEFLPQSGTSPVLVHELESNMLYEPVITTYAGLYRYRLGDLIQVGNKTERTPNIAFYGRCAEEANLSGERVHAALLLEAAQRVCKAQGLSLQGFALWANEAGGYYEAYVELSCENSLPLDWGQCFDKQLQELAEGYRRRRKDGSIAVCKAVRMKCGWENERATKRGNAQEKSDIISKKSLIDTNNVMKM